MLRMLPVQQAPARRNAYLGHWQKTVRALHLKHRSWQVQLRPPGSHKMGLVHRHVVRRMMVEGLQKQHHEKQV